MANELQSRPEGGAVQRWQEFEPGYALNRHHQVVDASKLSQFIRRNYKLFLSVLVLTLLATVVVSLLRTKMYTTSASVMLDQRKQQVVQGLDEVVSNLPSDSSVVDTEVALLSSPGMAYQVARLVGLVSNADPQKMTPDQQQAVSETLLEVIKRRTIKRVGLTYMIEIFYESPDPVQAQTMANTYAQTYVASQIDVRRRANDRARAHLEEEITKLQAQVKQADAAVARYKAAHNLTNSTIGGTLTEQEIASYNQTLVAARAQSAEDSRRLASARAQLARGTDAMGDSTSPGLIQLRAQEATISAQVAQLESRYGPNHPELINARNQLADVRKLIAAQSNRSIASLQTQAEASAGRTGAIQGRLSATESALKQASNASVELHELEMKLDAPQKLLEAYQARLAQISTQSGAEQADARIVSFAPLPIEASSPNWIISMIVGFGLGLIFGTAAVAIRHIFAVGVASGEEVEGMFGVDFLAALPRLKSTDDIEIIDNVIDEPHAPFAEALRALAAGVMFTGGQAPRVIGISSPGAEEGKTTTSLCLGRVLALQGRRALVIDCDAHRRAFYQRFGIGGDIGLVEVLRNPALLDQAIVSDKRSPAQFLPLGQELEPGKTLDETALASLLDVLRGRYDVVVLDLPPALLVAEARVIASLADTNVLLARWKHTSKQAIEAALAILLRANAQVAGVALTQVPATSEIMLGGYSQPRLASASA